MKKPRVGRPPAKLAKPTAVVTRRVRRLVDIAHEGNINEASRVSGVPYATLRDLYSGRSTNPNVNTLTMLAEKYEIFLTWFTDAAQAENIPMSGWLAYVPPRTGVASRTNRRETRIPFAAWPLISVIRDLEAALLAMPPARDRPIYGASDDADDMNLRMSSFLLSPILEAEKKTNKDLIYISHDFSSNKDGAGEKWISELRIIGQLWRSLLPGAIGGMRHSD